MPGFQASVLWKNQIIQPGAASSLANQSNERVTNVLQLLRSSTPSTFARSRVVTSNTEKLVLRLLQQ